MNGAESRTLLDMLSTTLWSLASINSADQKCHPTVRYVSDGQN